MTHMLNPANLPPVSAIPEALRPTLAEIMRREGTRFEDDPDDPGGATECGISLAFARAARLDVDGNGSIDLNDIKAVTVDLAERVIVQTFYREPGIDSLPEPVRPVLLDTAFNCGLGGAAAVVRGALIEMGVAPAAAGVLRQYGTALSAMIKAHGAVTVTDALVRARITRYRRLATNHLALSKYLNGWVLRALHYASKDMRERYDELLERYGETP